MQMREIVTETRSAQPLRVCHSVFEPDRCGYHNAWGFIAAEIRVSQVIQS
jgi:hypothetical protein